MIYNKNRVMKANDKKILHKVGKHWQVVSLALLMAIGGGVYTQLHTNAHADTTNTTVSNHSSVANQSKTQLIKNTVNTQLNRNYNNLRNNAKNNMSNNVPHQNNQATTQGRVSTNNIQQQANNLHQRILANATQSTEINHNNYSHKSTIPNHVTDNINNSIDKANQNNNNARQISKSKNINNVGNSDENSQNINFNKSVRKVNNQSKIKFADNKLWGNPTLSSDKDTEASSFDRKHRPRRKPKFDGAYYSYNKKTRTFSFDAGNLNFNGHSIISGVNVPKDLQLANTITFGSRLRIGTHQNMSHAFSGNRNVKTIKFNSAFSNLTLPNFKSSVENTGINMSHMFQSDSNLENMNLGDLDTHEATNMSYMFASDINMKSFGVEKVVDTSNSDNSDTYNNLGGINDNSGINLGAYNLKEQDTSINLKKPYNSSDMSYNSYHPNLRTNFITNNVTNMNHMFSNDTALSYADLSTPNFNTENVNNMEGMFQSDNFKNVDYDIKEQWKESDVDNDETDVPAYLDGNYSQTSNLSNSLILGTRHNYDSYFSQELSAELKPLANGGPDSDYKIKFNDPNKIINESLNGFTVSKLGSNDSLYVSDVEGTIDTYNQRPSDISTYFTTNNVTNMNSMFADDTKLSNLNLYFNTQNVAKVAHMFKNLDKSDTGASNNQIAEVSDMGSTTYSDVVNLGHNDFKASKISENDNGVTNTISKNTTLNGLPLSNYSNLFNFKNVKDMEGTFEGLTMSNSGDSKPKFSDNLTNMNISTNLINSQSLFSDLNLSSANYGSDYYTYVPDFKRALANWDFKDDKNMNSMFKGISKVRKYNYGDNQVANVISLPSQFSTLNTIDVSDMFANNADVEIKLSPNFNTTLAYERNHMKDFYANTNNHTPDFLKIVIPSADTYIRDNASNYNTVYSAKDSDTDLQALVQNPFKSKVLNNSNNQGNWLGIGSADVDVDLKFKNSSKADYISDVNQYLGQTFTWSLPSDLRDSGWRFTKSDLNVGTINYNHDKGIMPSDAITINSNNPNDRYVTETKDGALTVNYKLDIEHPLEDMIIYKDIYSGKKVKEINYDSKTDPNLIKKNHIVGGKNKVELYHSYNNSDTPQDYVLVQPDGNFLAPNTDLTTEYSDTPHVFDVAPFFDGMTYKDVEPQYSATDDVTFEKGTMQNGVNLFSDLFNQMSKTNSNLENMNIAFSSDINTDNITNVNHMFSDNLPGCSLNSINLPKNFCQNAKNAEHAFNNVNEINLSKGDFKNVEDAKGMFENNSNVSDLALPSDFGKNITNSSNMFSSDNGLTHLSLPNGKLISNAQDMFQSDYNLNNIAFSSDFGSQIANGNNMFTRDEALKKINLPTNFGQQIISANSMFRSDTQLSKEFLNKNFNTANANDLSNMFASDSDILAISLPSDFETQGKNLNGLIANDKNLNYISILNSDAELDNSITNGSSDNKKPNNTWYPVISQANGIIFTGSDATRLNPSGLNQGTWVSGKRSFHTIDPILHFVDNNSGEVLSSDNLGATLGSNDYVGYVYTIPSNLIPNNFKLANGQSNQITFNHDGRYIYNVKVASNVRAGNIVVNYINQAGNVVSQQAINCTNKYGQMINVLRNTIMPQPNNYQVDRQDFRSDYRVTKNNQLVTIPLTGKYNSTQNDTNNQIKVNLFAVNSDGSTSSLNPAKIINLTGQIGNYIDLNANQFTPNNYQVDSDYTSNYQLYLKGLSDNHSTKGIVYNAINTRAMNGHTFNFYYKAIPNGAGNLNIHYRLINSDGSSKLLSNTSSLNFNKSDIGKQIDLANSIPSDYTLLPNQYTTYKVTNHNQSITLNVKANQVQAGINSNDQFNINLSGKLIVKNNMNGTDTSYNSNSFTNGVKNYLLPVSSFKINKGQTRQISLAQFAPKVAGLHLVNNPTITVTCNSNGLTPSLVSNLEFDYQVGTPSKNMASDYHTNTVHYISSSDLGQFSYDKAHDIDWQKNHSFVTTITNHGTTSDNYSDAPYRENVPTGYQFVKVYQTNNSIDSTGLHNFANTNQSEVIEVIPNASPVTFHYVNSDGKTVKTYRANSNMLTPIKNDGVHGYTSKFNQAISSDQIDTPTNNYNQLGMPIGYKIAKHKNNTAEDQLVKFSRQPQTINVMVTTPHQEGQIKVVYLNHGRQVGNSDVMTGIVGKTVNVTNSADGGLNIPKGYSLLGGIVKNNGHSSDSDVKGVTQDTTYRISKHPHTVFLRVNGDNENDTLNVTRIVYLGNGKAIKSVVPVNLNGSNGSIKEIKASDYNPNRNKYSDTSDDINQYVKIDNNQSNPNNVTFYYHNNHGTVTVRYIDAKTGQSVATPINMNGIYGQIINLTNLSNVPQGYTLLSNNIPSIRIDNPVQNINLYVQGKAVNNINFNVRQIREDIKGNLIGKTSDVPVQISGHIGDTITINPYFFNKNSNSDIKSVAGGSNNYKIPDGYHATASDADLQLRINSDGKISPVNNITYIYQQDYSNPTSNLSTVKVHYITSNNDNGDGKIDRVNGTNYHELDAESDRGVVNQDTFDLTPYTHDIPSTVANSYSLDTSSLPTYQNGTPIQKNNYKFKFPSQATTDVYIKVNSNGNSPLIL